MNQIVFLKTLELTGYKDELVKEGTLDSQMRLENLDELLTSAFEFENLYVRIDILERLFLVDVF